MKVALAQINTKVGDLSRNFELVKLNVEKAKQKGADLVVFPELSLTGYPPRDLLDFEIFVEDNLKKLDEITQLAKDIAIVTGFVDFNLDEKGKAYFNSLAFLENQKIKAKYNKKLLPFYDVFDETRYFEPGENPHSIEFKGKKIGLSICEDVWNDKSPFKRSQYKQNPLKELFKDDVDFVINISASPYYLEKERIRFEVISQVSKKYKKPLVYVNQVGSNDDLIFDGTSFVCGQNGDLKARAKSFEEDLLIYDFEEQNRIEKIPLSKEESLYNALILGLRDYMAKMGFKKVMLGMSGGIDSALTATIACHALGAENVLGITMPSMYSSKGSVSDSIIIAQNLGMKCLEIPIKPMFDAFVSNIQEGIQMDLAEENLQARIRGNILMTYSNRYGYMLLSTGNKSEMAVGYCTLYGDMAGGLNLLSDVPKTLVYSLSKYINKDSEIIPDAIITKPPSAELRPDQKDEDSLPAYEVLDDILTDYIEYNKAPEEIYKKHSKSVVDDVIKKVNRNEYKRNQATLGLKVTTKAFGQGRRFPIVQGYDFRM